MNTLLVLPKQMHVKIKNLLSFPYPDLDVIVDTTTNFNRKMKKKREILLESHSQCTYEMVNLNLREEAQLVKLEKNSTVP